MNPSCELRNGETVSIINNSPIVRSYLTDSKRPPMAKVMEIMWDGRKHARFISCIRVSMLSTGDVVTVGLDQLMVCDANFEPKYRFLTCLHCGAIVRETSIKITPKLDNKGYCPYCLAHDAFKDC